jgi:hypothetical protein
MIVPGSRVKLATIPTWVKQLPEQSQLVFASCLGRVYSVTEVDVHGLFVLDVSAEMDSKFGGFMNDIRVEREFLEQVS